ncbi:MAG TPA: DUF3159 domain-containing protein [Aeromicrobium sp.]|nr:DUF3159 domain-containing protein [Aeromicrobium sp.]
MTRIDDAFESAEDEFAHELESEYLELTDPKTRRRERVWQLVDGGLPFLVFYAGYQWRSVVVGASAALAVAAGLAVVRLIRGERLIAVGFGAFSVALSSTIAIASGQGRGFFVTGLAFNTIALAITAGSLVISRPVTGQIGQRLGREQPTWRQDPKRYRTHQKMTAFWVLLWVVHLAVLIPLFMISAVGTLTLLSTFVLKPSILLWLVITFAWGERSRASL